MLQDVVRKTGKAFTTPYGGPLPVRRVPGERAARLSSGGFADLDLPVPEPKSFTDKWGCGSWRVPAFVCEFRGAGR